MQEASALNALLAQIDSPLLLLRQLFEDAPLGIQVYNTRGHCIYVNSSFLQIFGVAPPLEYSVLQDDVAGRAGVLPLIHRAFAGEIVNLPIAWYDPGDLKEHKVTGGKKVAIATRILPILSVSAEVTQVLFLFKDVTDQQIQIDERQKVTKQLNDANALISDLLNGTHAVIYFKDLNSAFILVNRQFEVIFAMKSVDLIGKTGHQLFPKEVADEFRRNDLLVIESGTAQEVEESVVHADGSRHTYISLKFPLRDSESKIIGLCGISTDITQSRRTELELSSARRIESLGVLAGGLAHDFNNLLGVILMHAEDLPGAQAIKTSAERASELTRKLLAFGRQQVLKPVKVDLNAVISEMHDILERVVGADIQFEVKLNPGLNYIYADRSQLEQVLMNLCVNARDAMASGGSVTLITDNAQLDTGLQGRLVGAKSGPYVKLSVRDTGQGISAENMERIFEPILLSRASPAKDHALRFTFQSMTEKSEH